MAYAFIIVGVILVRAGYTNQLATLGALVAGDFSGSDANGKSQASFLPWLAAVAIIGGLGYVKPIQPISRAFLILILVVFVLKNGGVFSQFTSAVAAFKPSPAPSEATAGGVSQDQGVAPTGALQTPGNTGVTSVLPDVSAGNIADTAKNFFTMPPGISDLLSGSGISNIPLFGGGS